MLLNEAAVTLCLRRKHLLCTPCLLMNTDVYFEAAMHFEDPQINNVNKMFHLYHAFVLLPSSSAVD